LSTDHKQCRSFEALHCARSRRCEEELERAWIEVKIQEEEMRRIHWEIHGEWCLGNAPDHPGLADPFHWTITEYKEGAETSQSVQPYPAIDLADDVVDFRTFSVSHFGEYIVQLPKVQRAWQLYAEKLDECARLEFTLETQIESCDDKQILLHDKACEHSAEHRLGTSTHAREYHDTMVAYTAAVETIQQLEFDRKREWETLHIVTCLLETVYTHVITAIETDEPCPTTESHPNQTESEINYCHVIEVSLTANLTIDYGNPPPLPECNLTAEPPCTAEYIWDEHGMFPLDIQTTHSAALAADPGLDAYFTTLSWHGWAGCAAPRACIPCEDTDIVVDPTYESHEVCKAHQKNLYPGQLDFDTFKCQSGDQCIMAGGRCNGHANCDDGSDEIGCDTTWGIPAVMHSEVCREPFVSDIQFRCADGSSCTHIEGRCNGVSNCADGSDESGCSSGTTGLTGEAGTGREFALEVPALHSSVFFDREYTFDSFGGLTGMTYLKMSNEDKHTRHSHVQMKLRLPHPLTVYVVKLTDHELPWLHQEGWAMSSLEGVSYHGARETRHKEWSGILEDDFYGPGVVYQKTFPAGTVEMRGNNGGDGSYLIFLGNPMSPPAPPPIMYCDALAIKGNDGNGIVSSGSPDSASSIQFIDLGAGAFQNSGEMLSVSYHVSRANQAAQKFQIYRPVSGNIYHLVSETDALVSTQVGDVVHHSLATALQFQPGDFIGWVHTGQGTFPYTGGAGDVRFKYGIEAVGSDIDFSGFGARVYAYELTYTAC